MSLLNGTIQIEEYTTYVLTRINISLGKIYTLCSCDFSVQTSLPLKFVIASPVIF